MRSPAGGASKVRLRIPMHRHQIEGAMEQTKTTELFQFHLRHGGKIVEFAGYRLPIHYRSGILLEHLATRYSAGLFDVSHMGQILVRPRGCDMNEAALQLESVLPADVADLPVGRQCYSLLTSDSGGIIDDLMIARKKDSYFIVVNAARKAVDLEHLENALAGSCVVEAVEDRSLVALQGPDSEAALGRFAPDAAKLRFMDSSEMRISGSECWISRSGYTGEDGFEISVPAGKVEKLAERILDSGGVLPIGLGARDSLRLEAGLCLYGNDIDLQTSPVEAGLQWGDCEIAKEGRRKERRISRGGPNSRRIGERSRQETRRNQAGGRSSDARRHEAIRRPVR